MLLESVRRRNAMCEPVCCLHQTGRTESNESDEGHWSCGAGWW